MGFPKGLPDGYSCTIQLSNKPNIKFYEKETTPPEIDGGGAIDTVTMHNLNVRTQSPKSLYSVGDTTVTVMYDPQVYQDIISQVNENQSIEVLFPNGDLLTFWGWLGKFKPGPLKEGQPVLAEVVLHASNVNNTGNETEPVWS